MAVLPQIGLSRGGEGPAEQPDVSAVTSIAALAK
jgi:hypothetical protein